MENISLQNYNDTISINLSGGLKRRLSIGMGLIGESKILILDEPTSGLDPLAREQIWTLIKKLKKERCILMTT